MKNNLKGGIISHRLIRRILSILVIFSFVFSQNAAYALPQGENVVSGEATFDRAQPNTLNINVSTDRMIANWQSFSIAQPEAVHFYQPSSSSVALNRVVGAEPSSIFGALTATGKIFLVNPNGVLFGPNSYVDTAGLVASTLNLSNQDFLAGRYTFYGPGGSIVNQGYISTPGGFVGLLGSRVENSGVIEASLGSVALAAGDAITLNLDPQGLISVVIDEATTQNLEQKEEAVKNTGEIIAAGGKIVLTAEALEGVFAQAVNNQGIVEAQSLVNNEGVVELRAEGLAVNSGVINVSGKETGANGGAIDIASDTFFNAGSILANAADYASGGDINIIVNEILGLETTSIVEVKGKDIESSGGEVYLYSFGDAYAKGNQIIDFSGGAISGDAGRGEFSAQNHVSFGGNIIGRAQPGFSKGLFIVDPEDATIDEQTVSADTIYYTADDMWIIGNVTIDSGITLGLFADHNSETPGDWHDGIGTLTRTGDYTVAGGFDTTLNLKAGSGMGTSDTPLKTDVETLSAEINPDSGGDIYISQGTTALSLVLASTPGSAIDITTGSDLYVDGPVSAGGSGTINLSAIGTGDTYLEVYDTISSLSGAIDLTVIAENFAGLGIFGGEISSTEGNITLNSESTSDEAAIWVADGEITSETGSIALNALAPRRTWITVEAPINTTVGGSGDISLTATTIGSDNFFDEYYADIEVYSPIETVSGNISLTATNTVTNEAVVDDGDNHRDYSTNYAEIGIYDVDITSDTGNITLKAANTVTNTITGDGSISYIYYDSESESYAEIEIGIDGGGATVSTTGDITITADNRVTRDVTADSIDGYFDDYSYRYAYINISDTTLDTTSDGTSEGAISISATNSVTNTLDAGDYLYDYYDESENYTKVYINSPGTILTDLGDINITADNTFTRNISADYIEYVDDYTDNYADLELYDTPIESESGNIDLSASNTVNTTLDATADGNGEIYYIYDESYNYAKLDVDGGGVTIATTGDITITADNAVTRYITTDYFSDYYEDYSYNYADLDVSDTTLDTTSDGTSEGAISISATNSVTNTLDAGDYLYDYYDYSENYTDVYINSPGTILTDLGNISISADNTFTRNISADYLDWFEDYTDDNYADLEIDYTPIESESGNIDLSATNTVNTTVNGNDEIYYIYDESYNYAKLDVDGSGVTIATTGDITITADNAVTRYITTDYFSDYYEDSSRNYADLEVSDTTLDTTSGGTSEGAISISATNSVTNTLDAGNYLYDYYDHSKNYTDVYINSPGTILTDLGNINITADNTFTRNISADDIDWFEDYTYYNYADLEIDYTPIESESGGIDLSATNTVNTTVDATADGNGEIYYYYYDSSKNYAKLDVDGGGVTIATTGDITITADNAVTRDITTDYFSDYYEDSSRNYADLDISDTTLDTTSGGTSEGAISISATNSVTNTLDAGNYLYDYYDHSRNYAELDVDGSGVTIATTGDITITADNAVTRDITTDYLSDYYKDSSDNYADLDVYYTTLDTTSDGTSEGTISISATNLVTNTLDAGDYLYDYYDNSENYTDVYIESPGTILTDLGDINITADNTFTRNISADDIDWFDDYTDNYADLELYDTPIESESGNIDLSATNTVNTTVDGDVDEYYDYSEGYASIDLSPDDTVLTDNGDIDITATSTGDGYQEAYINIDTPVISDAGGITVTAEADGEEDTSYISVDGTVSTTTGNINMTADDYLISGGTIISDTGNITLENSSPDRLIVLGYTTPEDDLEIDDDEIAVISTAGLITIGSDTAGDMNVETAEFDTRNIRLITGDTIDIFGTLSTTTGNISIYANDYLIGGGTIISDTGDITLANTSPDRPIVLGYTTEDDDLEIDDEEIENIITTGLITIGSDTSGPFTVDTVDFAANDLTLISGDTLDDTGEASAHIIADTLSLSAGDDIGSDDNPLNIQTALVNAEAGGLINLLANDSITLGSITGEDFVNVRTTSGDLTILTGTVTSNTSGVGLTTDTGSVYAEGAGPHIVAQGDSFINAPQGKIAPSGDPLNVLITGGDLTLDIANLDILAFSAEVYGNLIGTVTPTGLPLLSPTNYPLPINPPGYVYFNGIQIWPPSVDTGLDNIYINQLLADALMRKLGKDYLEFLSDYRTVSFDQNNPNFYAYHPLIPTDLSAFDGIILDIGAYEFINGNLNLKNQDTLYPYYEEEGQKKKKL